MLIDVVCQLDQPNMVKNVSLYLAAPGSNPGARILKRMLPQLCELCISDTYPESNSAMCLLGMARLCELRTSDTYSASNVAKRICELCTSDTYPALMPLNKYAVCALRIRIPRLTVLCCLLGVEQPCELSISGHGDWKVAGGVDCNGKYFA